MTRCEHCTKIVIAGQKRVQCTPLSSAVVVHGAEQTLRCYKVQVCPTRGVLSKARGRLKGCAVANIADEQSSSTMSKRGWADLDKALQDAKSVEAQNGRRFGRIRRFNVYDST